MSILANAFDKSMNVNNMSKTNTTLYINSIIASLAEFDFYTPNCSL